MYRLSAFVWITFPPHLYNMCLYMYHIYYQYSFWIHTHTYSTTYICGTSQNSFSNRIVFRLAIKSKTKLVHFRKLHFASLTTHLSNAYVVRLLTHTHILTASVWVCACVNDMLTNSN